MKAILWAVRLGIASFGFVLFFLLLHLTISKLPNDAFVPPSATVTNQLGAVASESKPCTQIGIDLLSAGGNAADALVGTTFCVGVVGMYHSGIGGGGFALVQSEAGPFEAIDFREQAPAAAHQGMFEHDVGASQLGGLASGVPGELRGLEYIHKKWGKLSWTETLQPAINIARDGFLVGEDLLAAMGLPSAHDRRGIDELDRWQDFLTNDPVWAIDFAPNGTRLGLGDVMTRKRYADTLEAIALEGADVFYSGRLGEDTVAAVQRANGSMTSRDLQDYSVAVREPVVIDYHGYHVVTCGTPASGAVVASVLKTVEGYDSFFASSDFVNLSTHRLDEAIRFGYAKRASLGDPDFLPDMHDFEQGILTAEYASSIRDKISDEHTLNVSAYDPNGFADPPSHGTSQISAASSCGLSISLTSTVNLFFGSRLMVPSSGIILNNQMNDFSIPGTRNAFNYTPSPTNYIRPRKRPLSSISPLLITHPNNTLVAVLGAAGGSRIPTTVIQNALTLLHSKDEERRADEVLKRPRMHDQLLPNRVDFERGFDKGTAEFMEGRGHAIRWVEPGFSSAHLIRRLDNGTFEAAAEPRQKDSAAMVV